MRAHGWELVWTLTGSSWTTGESTSNPISIGAHTEAKFIELSRWFLEEPKACHAIASPVIQLVSRLSVLSLLNTSSLPPSVAKEQLTLSLIDRLKVNARTPPHSPLMRAENPNRKNWKFGGYWIMLNDFGELGRKFWKDMDRRTGTIIIFFFSSFFDDLNLSS